MEQEVFKPLGIKSVGYGAPEGRNVVRGHFNGRARPTGYGGDNPAIYGPAGGLHISLGDWAIFAQDQLNGHLGKGKLLQTESYQKLHTPVTDRYALGWGISKNSNSDVVRLTHDGSNTMWYALAWVAPEIDRAFLVVTNSRDEHSHPTCDRMIGKLIGINQGK